MYSPSPLTNYVKVKAPLTPEASLLTYDINEMNPVGPLGISVPAAIELYIKEFEI
jgi:hypothetical protein